MAHYRACSTAEAQANELIAGYQQAQQGIAAYLPDVTATSANT